MASIAYISDKDMMEYHRLNGNMAINFWRPGTKRNISNLQEGDLIFFLVKTSARRAERGIAGYGIFREQKIMSFNRMWNQYETLNGYDSKESLKQAVERMTKDKQLPKEINCLWIEDLIFFQSPIYLSEFGIELSNRVESYIYVDKDDPQLTNKILRRAQDIGVDFWLSTVEKESTDEIIDQTRIAYLVAEVYERLKIEMNTEAEERKLSKLCQQLLVQRSYQEYEIVKGSQHVLYRIRNQHLDLQLSFISPSRKAKEKLLLLIGQISLYVELLSDKIKDIEIHAAIILHSNISEELERLLSEAHIRYHYLMPE